MTAQGFFPKELKEQEPGVFILDGKSTAFKTTISGEKKLKIILEQSSSLDIEFILENPGASLDFTSICNAKNSEIQKINLSVIHSAPNTTSFVRSKGAAFDSASIELKALARVGKNATGSKSRVECRALLLGKQAKAKADPVLEILDNDVECSHAASVKEIDKNQIFYLQTRGLSEKESEELIVEGFLQ